MKKLLEIKNLKTIAEDDHNKEILKGLNLTINAGEVHVIMGPNGSGKSTLANTCFNSPKYIITDGTIEFDGEVINDLTTDQIARKGLFMSFQTPEDIPGITVANFIKTVKTSMSNEKIKLSEFYKDINEKMEVLNLNKDFAHRELNVGFSGGEKKKNEMLQLLMFNPKLAILDETDSGLDVDAINIVSKGISEFKNENNAVLIITHSKSMLSKINVDKVHILINGKIVESGDKTLIDKIINDGFKDYLNE